MKAYKIAFRGLAEGRHNFDYVLDEAFFNAFPMTEGTNGEVKVTVELVKSSLLMEVNIRLNGEVEAICDRCLCEMKLPIEAAEHMIVKQSNREEGNDDDFIVLAPDDDYIDMSSYLYEIYMLNYPMRVVHPDGECDESMEEALDEYLIDEDDKPTDPRWDALKKLIN
ncbi:MAG: YceD family protein [Marinifilaceae bacterium]